ncbi:MAG TPA: type IV pilin protein [Steroidobacteraceae bacterium]|nr:type IV pilin protein [Steroidobacteraceae bacterium]
MRRTRAFTLVEVLTALVVIGVLAAIAIPTWRTHLLRVRRADARDSLVALQAAQDRYFGRHARYASGAQLSAPDGLGLAATSKQGLYSIVLDTSADELAYTATARPIARAGQDADDRCAVFSIDHVGQMRAVDSAGADRSQDCWK